MIESRDWNESFNEEGPLNEVEAMVRAAGDYVQASDDLRPRVLETARTQCGEQRAQRCIQRIAVCFVLLAVFTTSGHHSVETAETHQQGILAAADSDGIFLRAEATVIQGGDCGWGMVEAFSELRRRQAEVLRPAR